MRRNKTQSKWQHTTRLKTLTYLWFHYYLWFRYYVHSCGTAQKRINHLFIQIVHIESIWTIKSNCVRCCSYQTWRHDPSSHRHAGAESKKICLFPTMQRKKTSLRFCANSTQCRPVFFHLSPNCHGQFLLIHIYASDFIFLLSSLLLWPYNWWKRYCAWGEKRNF